MLNRLLDHFAADIASSELKDPHALIHRHRANIERLSFFCNPIIFSADEPDP
jgi:hypothetical protein